MYIVEGNLEAKTSDNMDTWKSNARKKLREGESQKREDKRGRRSEREKVRREKMQVHENIGKVTKQCVFSNDLWLRGVEK